MSIDLVDLSSSQVDNYFLLNNSVYPKQEIPDSLLKLYAAKNNYIKPQTTTTSDIGTVVSSGYTTPYLPVHVFYPSRLETTDFKKGEKINDTEQWLSNSKDLNDTAFIGYVFNTGETHFLNKIDIIRRLGPQGSPAKQSPSPEIVVVEYTQDGKTWEPLSDELCLSQMMFFDTTSIDFGDKVDVPAKGFRLVIKSWYPGCEENMITGLYRVFFTSTPATHVRFPNLECHIKGYSYGIPKKGLTISDEELNTKIREIIKTEFNNDTIEISKDEIIQIVQDYIPTSISTFITSTDGFLVDLSQYYKSYVDVVLLENEEKDIIFTSKKECVSYFNFDHNKGKLNIHSKDIPFKISGSNDNHNTISLFGNSNSILLRHNGDHIYIQII